MLLWMVLATTLIIQVDNVESCVEEEMRALLDLNSYFKSHNYPQDGQFEGLGDQDTEKYNCCLWRRVHCDPMTLRVTTLDLGEMVTPSNPWVLNVTVFRPFTELINLDLSNNEIAGLVENEGVHGR